jgi:hypothetical protein
MALAAGQIYRLGHPELTEHPMSPAPNKWQNDSAFNIEGYFPANASH